MDCATATTTAVKTQIVTELEIFFSQIFVTVIAIVVSDVPFLF